MGQGNYKKRAESIYLLLRDTRCLMEAGEAGTLGDRAALLCFAVELVNKLLYCFMLAPDLLEQIDERLNRSATQVTPDPESIQTSYGQALGVVRELEARAAQWCRKYAA